ncbi:MAG: DUF5060 domain-containing protein [Caldilineaceae bacterium]|nr:DUF5060 domain-containing protein [Caldilineaceae bacterium]
MPIAYNRHDSERRYRCNGFRRLLYPYLKLLTLTSLLLLTACSVTPLLTYAPAETACAIPTEPPTIPRIAPGTSGEAAQWKVHQHVLNASQEYANPYTDVVVNATFSGPNAEQQQVQGFWDGGGTFIVRFTPPSPGEWSYSITSVPADAGLTQSGSFTAAAASPGETGFVRRDPAHPYSFVYDNGERYFMMGQTYYDIVRTACAGDAWQEGVLESQQVGINKVRLFVHGLGFGPDHRHPDYYPPAYAFADDNHDQLDIAYWQQLDEVVLFLANQGMLADLLLFMRPSNTPDELAFGSQEQDERYVRYILARYAAFPNVIWCVTNEWEYTGKDEAYWDTIGGIVRAEDPWMTQGDAHRLLSIHNATGGSQGGKFSYFDSAWPVHASVQYGVRNAKFKHGDEWANYSIVQNHGREMPVVNDEYGYIGETEPVNLTREEHRRALWAIAVGGGYGAVGDSRIFNDGPNGEPARVIMTGHWHEAEEYSDIKRMVDFWTTQEIPYWQMKPENSLVTAGERVYVLAGEAESAHYVIYAAAGGEFAVTLPDGPYRVTRFDPRSGTSSAEADVSGGEAVAFTLPDSRDWVLHLSRNAP